MKKIARVLGYAGLVAAFWAPLVLTLAGVAGLVVVDPWHLVALLGLSTLVAVTALAWEAWPTPDAPPTYPTGYVGRFRHDDGSHVHVVRVEGCLFAYTAERPGVRWDFIGEVSGADLARWASLGATPVRKHGVASPK